MKDIFNHTFFHFFMGFVAIIAASLLSIFAVGMYETGTQSPAYAVERNPADASPSGQPCPPAKTKIC
jgi:hypothetical protein